VHGRARWLGQQQVARIGKIARTGRHFIDLNDPIELQQRLKRTGELRLPTRSASASCAPVSPCCGLPRAACNCCSTCTASANGAWGFSLPWANAWRRRGK